MPDQSTLSCKHLYPEHLGQISRVTHPPRGLLHTLKSPFALSLAAAVCWEAHVLCVTLNYVTSVCKRVKKQSQDKEPLPGKGITTHAQNNTHSFWTSEQPSVRRGKGHFH